MNMMKTRSLATAFAFVLTGSSALAADTFKFAVIDPLSGPAAVVTERILNVLNYSVKQVNAKGGLNGQPIEVLTFDNKMSPQETAVQAQKAIEQGARILQTSVSSGNTFALVDFVAKYNRRNPDHKVIVFDGASHDPLTTGEKCSYYSFSWVLNAKMKTRGLGVFLKTQTDLKKIYLINAEGSSGQTTRARVLEMLKETRPDIEIVGDETHPLQKISDYAPYIAKIRNSGADAVITSDWGADLALALKAAGEARLATKWFTYFSTGPGAPTSIKQAGLDNLVYSVFDGDGGIDNADLKALEVDFRKQMGTSAGAFPGDTSAIRALESAAKKAGSNNVDKLVAALEGTELKTVYGADAVMRPDDHQLISQMVISSFGPAKDGGLDEEATGWGWHTKAIIPAAAITLPPTDCNMKRP
jgi:branched-chain amino acid transport system substrate-binding protein